MKRGEPQLNDLMPSAERALEASRSSECWLGQVALRFFFLCGHGRDQQLTVLEENVEAFDAELSFLLQSCGLQEVIESGWPLFTLLALLRRSVQASQLPSRASSLAPHVRHWIRRVTDAWAAAPAVGPPPPRAAAFPHRLGTGWLVGKRRPPRGPACVAKAGLPLSLAAAASVKAAASREPRFREAYLRRAQKALSGRWRSAASSRRFTALLADPWPLCEALSLLEMALLAEMRGGKDTSDLSEPPALALGRKFRETLASRLDRLLPQALAAGPSPLAAVQGSVLPSEAFLFHTLADLENVKTIVESGVGRGGSTRAACAWAGAAHGRKVLALERAKLSEDVAAELLAACGESLELRAGDAFGALDLALHYAGAAGTGPAGENSTPVALLLDGPKGRVAVRLAEDAMRRFPGIRVAAVHDVPRLDPRYRDEEGRHLTRVAMEDSPCMQVFSDEPWFVARFARQLDVKTIWTDDSATTGTYGPLLGDSVRGRGPCD
eukprot:TRINITY_DN28529_c0_g1_i2.p1 TRINITY_DN28529_c0_g1~~TRINITY_DN28529_c0_g1_i2.p1  ORF type:complete len:495 (-),score=97.41 TRINITY_DN28529_c0_g1_i2:24-1508(-)